MRNVLVGDRNIKGENCVSLVSRHRSRIDSGLSSQSMNVGDRLAITGSATIQDPNWSVVAGEGDHIDAPTCRDVDKLPALDTDGGSETVRAAGIPRQSPSSSLHWHRRRRRAVGQRQQGQDLHGNQRGRADLRTGRMNQSNIQLVVVARMWLWDNMAVPLLRFQYGRSAPGAYNTADRPPVRITSADPAAKSPPTLLKQPGTRHGRDP